jgi:hypothetical protein
MRFDRCCLVTLCLVPSLALADGRPGGTVKTAPLALGAKAPHFQAKDLRLFDVTGSSGDGKVLDFVAHDRHFAVLVPKVGAPMLGVRAERNVSTNNPYGIPDSPQAREDLRSDRADHPPLAAPEGLSAALYRDVERAWTLTPSEAKQLSDEIKTYVKENKPGPKGELRAPLYQTVFAGSESKYRSVAKALDEHARSGR